MKIRITFISDTHTKHELCEMDLPGGDILIHSGDFMSTGYYLNEVENMINHIKSTYDIKYNKMFILHIQSNDEYAITYNVEQGNVSNLPENTILVHRKKDSNTLYTINALNELIKSLNGGVVNTKFPIEWKHYRNTILLTQHNELKQLRTKIYKIIEL